MIVDSIKQIQKEIEETCAKVGRDPSEVTLIAVSKTKPYTDIEEALKSGCIDFGENKVQELDQKYDLLPKNINWHMIGHLQRNKVKYLVGKAKMIHSVDSLRLANQIEKEYAKKDQIVKILIEVNIAGEESKFGVKPEETESLIREISNLEHVKVCGLMTIAPYTLSAEDNRIHFKNLKELSVDIGSKNIDNVTMSVLSMGMSGDYKVAIEEGATMIRVGTKIFGERNYNI